MLKKSGNDGIEIAPLRPLDDFILGSARFQVPDLNNSQKWANRVINNLIYYQTNYLLMAVMIFTIVGLLHPVEMVYGVISMLVILVLVYFVFKEHENGRKHPFIALFVILFGGCFVLFFFDALLIYLLGICLPISAVFIHASLRVRNFKNKVYNQFELLLQQRSPMAKFLIAVGIEGDES